MVKINFQIFINHNFSARDKLKNLPLTIESGLPTVSYWYNITIPVSIYQATIGLRTMTSDDELFRFSN
jgi:hypothetical protein